MAHIKEPKEQAQACIIWMHGLGADASDMMGLADQLPLDTPCRHVFIDAPKRPVTLNAGMVMPAWYDILGMELTDREDKVGIEHSESLIRQVMDEQLALLDFRSEQLYLAGFSQGGAMAIHTALHSKVRLGGVIALSAYLPLANHTQPFLNKDTPFFIGSGQFDPVVLPIWTRQSKDWLFTNGYHHIDFHLYPMEHSVCLQELNDLGSWLNKQIKGGIECL